PASPSASRIGPGADAPDSVLPRNGGIIAKSRTGSLHSHGPTARWRHGIIAHLTLARSIITVTVWKLIASEHRIRLRLWSGQKRRDVVPDHRVKRRKGHQDRSQHQFYPQRHTRAPAAAVTASRHEAFSCPPTAWSSNGRPCSFEAAVRCAWRRISRSALRLRDSWSLWSSHVNAFICTAPRLRSAVRYGVRAAWVCD